jgi:hypothetical protein
MRGQLRLVPLQFDQVMPTPGLCRVETVFARFLYISTLAVAAYEVSFSSGGPRPV